MPKYGHLFTITIFLLFSYSCAEVPQGIDIYMTTDWGNSVGENNATNNNLRWTMTSCVIKMDLISTHIATSTPRAGFITIADDLDPLDLVSIYGSDKLIAHGDILAEPYDAMTIFVSSASVGVEGVTYNAEIPQDYYSLPTSFTVKEGKITKIVISWDIIHSVKLITGKTTKVIFTPVFTIKRIEGPSKDF